MERLFQINELKVGLAPGAKVIKASDYLTLASAMNLSESLTKKADELYQAVRERENEKAQKANEEIYRLKEEARTQGRQEGRDEYAEKIMDAVLASVDYLENLEADLVKMVGETTRKIIGELPDDEVVVRIVKKALMSLRNDRRVTVRVPPKHEPAVREALMGADSRASNYLDVRADGRLEIGQCILESELGVVEASLETQLRNLDKALSSHIKTER
jgi:type III secretion protein L